MKNYWLDRKPKAFKDIIVKRTYLWNISWTEESIDGRRKIGLSVWPELEKYKGQQKMNVGFPFKEIV